MLSALGTIFEVACSGFPQMTGSTFTLTCGYAFSYGAKSLVDFFRDALCREQRATKARRLQAWRSRMQSSEKHAHQWMKATGTNLATTMRLPEGNVSEQLEAIRLAW